MYSVLLYLPVHGTSQTEGNHYRKQAFAMWAKYTAESARCAQKFSELSFHVGSILGKLPCQLSVVQDFLR
jgi:hypothetical protein